MDAEASNGMGRPRRIQDEDGIYVVSNRCIDGRAFFRPGPRVNAIIERALVWATDKHDIEMYAYLFELNEFELIFGAPRLNRQHFMRDFQSLLASELKALHGRDEAGFFAGRYVCEPLADRGPLLDEIARVLCRPCAAGLVQHPKHWPGVSSLAQHRDNSTRVVQREDRQLFWTLRRNHPDLEDEHLSRLATHTYTMQLALPFAWEVGDAHVVIRRAIDDLAADLVGARGDVVGADVVRTWNPRERPPRACPRRRRRRCIASSEESRKRFVEKVWNANLWYELGRRRLQEGLPNPPFPHGMIPLHEVDAVGAPRRSPSVPGRSPPVAEPADWLAWPTEDGAA